LEGDEEAVDAFKRAEPPEGWDDRNAHLAMLFLAKDLRIADAHDSVGESLQKLQGQGFDSASLHPATYVVGASINGLPENVPAAEIEERTNRYATYFGSQDNTCRAYLVST
jgi:hypothetical protein